MCLPEYVCCPSEEVLLLLVTAGAHSSLDDGQQRLNQTEDERAASLPRHKHFNQVQHLQEQNNRMRKVCILLLATLLVSCCAGLKMCLTGLSLSYLDLKLSDQRLFLL